VRLISGDVTDPFGWIRKEKAEFLIENGMRWNDNEGNKRAREVRGARHQWRPTEDSY